MKLGQIIKEYREKNNVSMRDFEKKSGLSRSYISLLEKDENISPTLPTIKKLDSIRLYVYTIINR